MKKKLDPCLKKAQKKRIKRKKTKENIVEAYKK